MDNYKYKQLTTEQMKEYIEKNAPADKAWFKSVAFDENGKYQHLIAKKAFAERYMPEIVPVAKAVVKKSDMFADW